MKILAMQAENFMGIKAITLSFEKGVVELSGDNGAGKSSTIKAIWAALQWRNVKKGIDTPVKKGEAEAIVRVELDKITVERTFTEDGKTKLKIWANDEFSSVITSPQKVLDSFVGAISFNPIEFAEMAPKQQVDLLLTLGNWGEVSPTDIDEKIETIYEERTNINRVAKEQRGALVNLIVPDDLPKEEPSIKKINEEIRLREEEDES